MASTKENNGWRPEAGVLGDEEEFGEYYWDEDAVEASRQADDEDSEATYGLNDSGTASSSELIDELRRGMGGRRV